MTIRPVISPHHPSIAQGERFTLPHEPLLPGSTPNFPAVLSVGRRTFPGNVTFSAALEAHDRRLQLRGSYPIKLRAGFWQGRKGVLRIPDPSLETFEDFGKVNPMACGIQGMQARMEDGLAVWRHIDAHRQG
jgi:hypothetical protein